MPPQAAQTIYEKMLLLHFSSVLVTLWQCGRNALSS